MSVIRCGRCGVSVPTEALDTPNRCPDWRCPTSSVDLRLDYAIRVGRYADFLATLDQAAVDRLAADRAKALADMERA